MERNVAARRDWPWLLVFGVFLLALCLSAPRAFAGETGSTDEYAGVPITNSVLLDPFDPVPTIQFGDGYDRDGHCYRDCGEYRHCREDCRWHGWYCPHDCYDMHRPRPGALNLGWWRCADGCRNGDWWCDHECVLEGWRCEHDCYVHEPCRHDCGRGREWFPQEGDRCPEVCYGRLMHEYEERLARHDEQAHRYEEQSHWYFEHVMEDHRGFFGRLFDFGHHDGPPPIPPGPPGPPPGPGPGYGPPGPPPGPGAGFGPPGPGPGGYGPPPGPPTGPGYGGPNYGPGPGYDGPPDGPPPGYGPGGPPPGRPPAGAPPGPGPSSFGPPATPPPSPH